MDDAKYSTTKACTKCGQCKDFSQYHAKPAGKFGLHSICKECRKNQAIAWQERNPDRAKEIQRDAKRRIRQTEEGRANLYRINKDYVKRHPQRVAAYVKNRMESDPVYAMAVRARRAVTKAMERGGYTKRSCTMEILGCDWPTFKAHIERQFTKGMGWDRMGEIHLDHIIPISSAKTEEDVLALSRFTNIRPCWAAENMRKSDSMEFLI